MYKGMDVRTDGRRGRRLDGPTDRQSGIQKDRLTVKPFFLCGSIDLDIAYIVLQVCTNLGQCQCNAGYSPPDCSSKTTMYIFVYLLIYMVFNA